jgi:hypothetical protein
MEKYVLLVESDDPNVLQKKHKCVIEADSLATMRTQLSQSLAGFQSFAFPAGGLRIEWWDDDFKTFIGK